MNTKICFKCEQEKELTAFYKHPQMADGHVNKCKECNKKDVQENYRKNLDHYREYERSRLHNPERVAARQEYAQWEKETRPEVVKRRHRSWADRNHDLLLRRRQEWVAKQGEGYSSTRSRASALKYPDKTKARNILGNAIRDGKIQRQSCERCGNDKTHGHHEDYTQPLDVMWLCSKCHGLRHRELNDLGIKL